MKNFTLTTILAVLVTFVGKVSSQTKAPNTDYGEGFGPLNTLNDEPTREELSVVFRLISVIPDKTPGCDIGVGHQSCDYTVAAKAAAKSKTLFEVKFDLPDEKDSHKFPNTDKVHFAKFPEELIKDLKQKKGTEGVEISFSVIDRDLAPVNKHDDVAFGKAVIPWKDVEYTPANTGPKYLKAPCATGLLCKNIDIAYVFYVSPKSVTNQRLSYICRIFGRFFRPFCARQLNG